jgi:glycosyltransferase involved in cell wall biosynthesis
MEMAQKSSGGVREKMRIGIDISQIVYKGTGVGTYVRRMVETLVNSDKKNEYILFGASFRRREEFENFYKTLPHERVRLVAVPIPPTLLDFVWNRLHVMPVEKLTGPLDVFWSSDWTQPPLTRARGVTTIHDLIALKFPAETDAGIVSVHKRRLAWVKKECKAIFCDSESTKKDVMELLQIPASRLHVIYPGI